MSPLLTKIPNGVNIWSIGRAHGRAFQTATGVISSESICSGGGNARSKSL